MNIQEIHWHDCKIRKVIELPASERLLFEVDYPVDWEESDFQPHTIVFDEVFTYEIHEGPFTGSPTILSASETNHGPEGELVVRLETSAGYRVIRCRSILLQKPE